MELFRFLVKYSPGLLTIAVLVGVMSGVASAAVMVVINLTLARTDFATPRELALAFAGATTTVLIASLGARWLLLHMSTNAVKRMRISLCSQILCSPLRDVEALGAPTLIATLTEDVLAVSDTLAEIPVVCINIAILSACFTYLVWLSWPLAVIYFAVFFVGVVIHEAIATRTRPHLAKGREKWDELIAYYQALILGNKELKLHMRRRQAFMKEALVPTAEEMRALSLRWHKIFAFAASFGQSFYFIVVGAILFLTPVLGGFEPVVVTGFVLITIFMNGPLSGLVGAIPTLQRAGVSLRKIESLGLSLSRPEPPVWEKEVLAPERFEALSMRGVRYQYGEDEGSRSFALGPIDLDLVPGEIVFVTGGNGSGKSSFARVLTGLYLPTAGTISINGMSVDDNNRDAYRQNFSAVFSDYFLFTRLYGLVDERLAALVDEYLRELELSDKVSLRDGGFSTTNLSQGQRKRLALLTAFVENRHIYLFDEWAADQDPAFKDVFYRRIVPQLKARGKTVVVISHDSHYYQYCDRLIRFECGELVEDRTVKRITGSCEVASDELA